MRFFSIFYKEGLMKNLKQVFGEYFKSVKDTVRPGSGLLRAAVMAGRKKTHCVLSREKGGGIEYLRSFSADIDCDFYGINGGSNDNTGQLRKFAGEMSAGIKDEYAVINIVLPDPLCALSVFSPGDPGASTSAAWRDILMLKASEKAGINRESLSFHPVIIKGSGSFAFSSQKVYTENMREILFDARLSPSASAPGITYVYDAFSEKFNGTKGALFLAEPEYWTFLLWDKSGMPLHMISRWFEERDGVKVGLTGAVSEVERRLRAYMGSNNGTDIEKFYTAGDGGLAGQAAGLIRERFDRECVELGIPGAGLIPVSLMAGAGA
jgi:hypothetical protein